MKYLDGIEKNAKSIGSVNTIVNKKENYLALILITMDQCIL